MTQNYDGFFYLFLPYALKQIQFNILMFHCVNFIPKNMNTINNSFNKIENTNLTFQFNFISADFSINLFFTFSITFRIVNTIDLLEIIT